MTSDLVAKRCLRPLASLLCNREHAVHWRLWRCPPLARARGLHRGIRCRLPFGHDEASPVPAADRRRERRRGAPAVAPPDYCGRREPRRPRPALTLVVGRVAGLASGTTLVGTGDLMFTMLDIWHSSSRLASWSAPTSPHLGGVARRGGDESCAGGRRVSRRSASVAISEALGTVLSWRARRQPPAMLAPHGVTPAAEVGAPTS